METEMSAVEFVEKYLGLKFFNYQKIILNLMEKWSENGLENKLESNEYAESEKE